MLKSIISGLSVLAVFLTVGQEHNFQLGNGEFVGLELSHSIRRNLDIESKGNFNLNKGYTDRSGTLDLVYSFTENTKFTLGSTYDKYTLLDNDPTETTDVHTSVTFKLW